MSNQEQKDFAIVTTIGKEWIEAQLKTIDGATADMLQDAYKEANLGRIEQATRNFGKALAWSLEAHRALIRDIVS
jgi:hypothetical protein